MVFTPAHVRIGQAGLGLALLATLGLGTHWCGELVAVDSCLDAGRVYDYARQRCDSTAVVLPVLPYAERHATIVLVASGLIVAGLGAAGATRAPRRWQRRDTQS